MTILIVLATIFAGSVMKGAIGIGLPLLATPILSIRLGVPTAVAIISIPIIATNLGQVWRYRRELPKQAYLPWFLGAGAVGTGLGTLVLVWAPVALLQTGLGLAVLLYLAVQLVLPPLELEPERGRTLAGPVGFLTGMLQGAVGLSGVVSIAFLQALHLERAAFVGTISSIFLMFSSVQILALIAGGTMTLEHAGIGTVSLLAAAAGMIVGERFAAGMSVTLFRRIIFAVLAVIAVMLVATGIPAI